MSDASNTEPPHDGTASTVGLCFIEPAQRKPGLRLNLPPINRLRFVMLGSHCRNLKLLALRQRLPAQGLEDDGPQVRFRGVPVMLIDPLRLPSNMVKSPAAL